MALDRFFVLAGKCLFSGKLPHFGGLYPEDEIFLTFLYKSTSLHQTGLFEPSTMMIGLSVWAVREPSKKRKKYEKSHKVVTNHPVRRAAAGDVTSTKLCTLGDPWDVITLAKFGLDRLDGFCSGGGQSLPFPIGRQHRPYNIATR
jgi:hypothetical protein